MYASRQAIPSRSQNPPPTCGTNATLRKYDEASRVGTRILFVTDYFE
jgi:hypothetical protein